MLVTLTFACLDILPMAATATATATARRSLMFALIGFVASHFGRHGRLLGR
jgi:hypothetical protein